MKSFLLSGLATLALSSPAASAGGYSTNAFGDVVSSLERLLQGDSAETGPFAPVTSNIIKDYVEPLEVTLTRQTSLSAPLLTLWNRRSFSATATWYALGLNYSWVASVGRHLARTCTG